MALPTNPAYEKGYCKAVQEALNNCSFKSGSYISGLFDAVISKKNTPMLSFTPSMTTPSVEVKYAQHKSNSSVANTLDPCAVGADPQLQSEAITIDYFHQDQTVIDVGEFSRLCSPDRNEVAAQQIQDCIDNVKSKVNETLIAYIGTNSGNLYGGAVPGSITLFDANGAINWLGVGQMMEEQTKLGCTEAQPILVGGGKIFAFAKKGDFACCNQNGLDESKISGQYAYFLDPYVGQAAPTGFGVNKFLVFQPGSIFLVPWYREVGAINVLPKNPDTHVIGKISDPKTGYMFNIDMIYNDCGGTLKMGAWTITISLHYDVFIPDSSQTFASGHPLYKTNGTVIFTAA